MNTGTITKEALNDYRAAIKSWLTLRNVQSTSQLRLAALLDTEEKPAAYASQLEDLREHLVLLEWQINCAARDGLYAHQIVLESCVTSAPENFMSEHGDALTDALAPFLCAPYGLEAAMKILRTAVARQTEVRTPVISAAYKSIIDETGLTVDASMRADASASFTPAQHKVFLARLNRLNEKGVC